MLEPSMQRQSGLHMDMFSDVYPKWIGTYH